MSLHTTEQDLGIRLCDHPDCREAGDYRAPVSPDRLREYFWFCKDHVRDYNAAWNYHSGRQQNDIEAQIRSDAVWNRPTWPMGAKRPKSAGQGPGFRDPFDFFADDGQAGRSGHAATADDGSEAAHYRALALFPPVTLTELKARYKELAKQLHPDVNGGDKQAEDRLKRINLAYTALKKVLSV